MTRAEIEQLSGEALRAAVAERVFGFSWRCREVREGCTRHVLQDADGVWYAIRYDGEPGYLWANDLPRYESDIAAAFEVVERMRWSRGYDFALDVSYHQADVWQAQFSDADGEREYAQAKTAPEAICRAALLALAAE